MKFEIVSHACLSVEAASVRLARNPDIELVDYGEVGIMGKMFLVNRAPDNNDKQNQ